MTTESGLEKQLKFCTFKNFQTESEWQKALKNSAVEFTKSDAVGFFVGGQSGCGKTHICTAMIGNFIKQGASARYFVWRENSTILKAKVNDSDYADCINEFKKTDILYIDDLFKQKNITDADIKLAFELIDYRSRQRLKTIISTELDENALIGCDEALAGRIYAYKINPASRAEFGTSDTDYNGTSLTSGTTKIPVKEHDIIEIVNIGDGKIVSVGYHTIKSGEIKS